MLEQNVLFQTEIIQIPEAPFNQKAVSTWAVFRVCAQIITLSHCGLWHLVDDVSPSCSSGSKATVMAHYLAVKVPESLAFQITILPLLGFWLHGYYCHRSLSCINCQHCTYWILYANAQIQTGLNSGTLCTYYKDSVAFFNTCSEKKTPFFYTTGFHLRGDGADSRQLNHCESGE